MSGAAGPLSAEVVVVGGGVEGCAAAWALTQRGVSDVVVVERDTVGSGGTGRSSGIVRCHYGVRSLAAMAWRGLHVLEQAEEMLGHDVGFHQTGYVVGVAEPNVGALTAAVEMQREVGIDVRYISHAEVAELWPWAELSDFAAFAYEPRGGYGDGHQTAQALASTARRGGARILQGTAVVSLVVDGERVSGVRLADGGLISAPTVVVAAGPWSPDLLSPVGVDVPIRVQREQILLLDPGAADVSGVPVFSDLVSLQYVRAERSTELLLGNSDMTDPDWVDSADGYRNTAPDAFVEDAVGRFMTRFPGLDDVRLSGSHAGCYDVTPDYNPVISRTAFEGLIVAAGFSGHGYKISPAVGELVADLVLIGRSTAPDIDESDFRLSRFDEGARLASPHPYVGAGAMR